MEKSAKSFLLQSLKAGLFSLIFACIGVLVLALLAQWFGIPDKVLPFVNQAIKVVAVVIGTAISVKDEKFVLKALVGAAIFWALSFVTFSLLGGTFHWGQIGLDLVIAIVASLIVSIVKSRRA